MTLLVLTSLVPLLAPALFFAVMKRQSTVSFLDGFVVMAVPGLVFLHTVPESLAEGEWIVLGALGLGLLLPLLSEWILPAGMRRTHGLAVLLGVSGLALHAAFEGAAVAALGPDGTTTTLGLAIIVHRLPVGLALWWLVRTEIGDMAAMISLAALVLLTVLGYAGGEELMGLVSGEGLHVYEAFVGGTLVHVVLHGFHPAPAGGPTPSDRRWEGLGGVAALAVLTGLAVLGDGGAATPGAALARRFMVLSAESAPALLLAYLAAGALVAFMPSTSIQWMSKGSSLNQAGRGMLVGLPLPVCSCGVVPLYRTLIGKGAPPAAAMAFLMATPELGIDAIFLSVPLLGPEMTLLRVGAAAVVALLVGWWVGGRLPVKASLPVAEVADEATPRDRVRTGLKAGLGTVVDDTAPWILVGLGVAALAAPLLEGGWLGALPAHVDVIAFAVLGFPTYVCASSATPLVATLLAAGLSPGAAIAFLITGPATNVTTLGVLSSLHGKKAAAAFALVGIGLAVGGGIALNVLVGEVNSPSMETLLEEPPGLLHQIALALLILLFLSSLVRRGVRTFWGELRTGLGISSILPAHRHEHDHTHSHGSGH
jgi:uncharacterized membrane protein YraQ (UPF0718 family)